MPADPWTAPVFRFAGLPAGGLSERELEMRCRKVLAEQLGLVNIEMAEILPGEDLAEGGMLDSLSSAEVILALEEEFDIDLDPYALAYSPDVPWSIARLMEVVAKALELKQAAEVRA